MSARQLNKEEREVLAQELSASFGRAFFGKKERVEVEDDVLAINGVRMFVRAERWVPLLRYLLTNLFPKKIIVDMGAVRFVTSGADVMRPGIKSIDSGIRKAELIIVVDEKFGKPLAVGVALFDAAEMQAMGTGKVVKNVHHVGDEWWTRTA